MKTTIKSVLLINSFLMGLQISAQTNEKLITKASLQTDTLVLNGQFNGVDLYVQNPMVSINKDTLWTAQQVYVNDSLILSRDQLKKLRLLFL